MDEPGPGASGEPGRAGGGRGAGGDALRDELLELALDIAGQAGRWLRDSRPDELAVAATKSSPTDVVTAMDRGSETLLVQRILAARPDDAIVGEEGTARPGTSGVRWVLDPLDGTVNYLYRLPSWAVSVGVQSAGRTVAGVVAAPAHGLTYFAAAGRGAYRRDDRSGSEVRLRANDPVALERALVATGFGYTAQRRASQGAVLARLLPSVRDIRRAGSCAIDLCRVADGRVDAYYEHGPQEWDHCAGALVAEEAGAGVALLPVAGTDDPLIVAAGPALLGSLLSALQESG
jgi:myo-inositol-1(or 4)-monophosphatase